MPCLFAFLVLAFPRFAIAVLYFFTTFLDRAYRFILDASYTSDPASQTTGYTYFNATVGLIAALTMSGNFYQ